MNKTDKNKTVVYVPLDARGADDAFYYKRLIENKKHNKEFGFERMPIDDFYNKELRISDNVYNSGIRGNVVAFAIREVELANGQLHTVVFHIPITDEEVLTKFKQVLERYDFDVTSIPHKTIAEAAAAGDFLTRDWFSIAGDIAIPE